MIDLKGTSWIVCSIVRNAADGLKVNLPVIHSFLKYVSDYKIVVFENDSKDNTKEILEHWKYKIGEDRFYLFAENRNVKETIPSVSEVEGVNPFYSAVRISKMVELRNQYMKFIEDKGWEADFLMIVDLDVAKLSLDNILSVFNYKDNWDAITANGQSLSPRLCTRYHDTYALTEWGDEANPQTEEKICLLSRKYGRSNKSDELIRVYSAFGGLSIYKFKAIKGLRYKLIYNDDPRVEVRCEHFSIYDQMVQKGYNRIFIAPSLRLKYQKITLAVVRGFFKRLFSN